MSADPPRVQIGILGCGPVSQAAHFQSVLKSRNTELHACCDVAGDLLSQMAATYHPRKTYRDYDQMLADPQLDAVIVATSHPFHVPASIAALQAGKHVLCEKPLGVSIEEVEHLKHVLHSSGRLLQVGHMKRFDAGLQSARNFIRDEMGQPLALKAWYCDSTHRYAVTDALQPVIVKSTLAKRPPADPKADPQRYNLLTHGCHLLDTARYLGGDITALHARLLHRFGAYCWFIDVSFASGALGHLDLTVSVRMDWHEGFHMYGENGSILARIYNPWLYKTSDVEIFRESTGTTSRVLGPDGQFYRRQLEAFAGSILDGTPVTGADIDDGLASVRAMVAISQSVRTGQPVRLADTSGSV